MAESGLLLHEKAGNQVFYQANFECPIYKVFLKAGPAIGARDWEPSVDYPPLRIVRFRSPYLEYGIENHVISGIDVPIYSIPKSLADAFRSRRFVDRSVAIECLRNAVEERKATPAGIAQAAKDCGAWKQMQPYLEAMTTNG